MSAYLVMENKSGYGKTFRSEIITSSAEGRGGGPVYPKIIFAVSENGIAGSTITLS